MSPCSCLHVNVSLSMSPCQCIPVNVSLSMAPVNGSLSMSPCQYLPVNISLSMSPRQCLPVNVSPSMSPCLYLSTFPCLMSMSLCLSSMSMFPEFRKRKTLTSVYLLKKWQTSVCLLQTETEVCFPW
jgi:hypothetical protein